MRAPRPVILALAATLLLGGCGLLGLGPSPKSTSVDADGATVTVDWKDYPATEGTDAEQLLEAPDQAELEAPARQLVLDLRAAVQEAGGVALAAERPEASWFDDEDWFTEEGNGYGGASMLATVNCCRLASTQVPDLQQWQRIVDAASEVTEKAGLGPTELETDSESMAADPAWREEHHDRFCTVEGGGCWWWSAVASDGYRWITLDIQDASLDPTGRGVDEAEEIDLPVASIRLEYGATVVRAGMKAEFEGAIAPFRGLERPASTRSD
ncbi:hypothetical protein [Isoptericola sp. NPDC057653]|uniref:hypothetical protein n=1 Tax=Isoptericola sp. NPDC057653 TaxID=3346195 RepID=UPI0036B7356E